MEPVVSSWSNHVLIQSLNSLSAKSLSDAGPLSKIMPSTSSTIKMAPLSSSSYPAESPSVRQSRHACSTSSPEQYTTWQPWSRKRRGSQLASRPNAWNMGEFVSKSRRVSARWSLITCALSPFFATNAANIPMIKDFPSPVPTRASMVLGSAPGRSDAPTPQARMANMSRVMTCVWCGIITTLKRCLMHSAAAPAISRTNSQSSLANPTPFHQTVLFNLFALRRM
mmetsp:Transcript_13623/g.40478  ORF Transcript_13623/g.40478 Transcript_13623/m.40478 type:complete len:225 (+) Transcript_13623:1677-2351(+)